MDNWGLAMEEIPLDSFVAKQELLDETEGRIQLLKLSLLDKPSL